MFSTSIHSRSDRSIDRLWRSLLVVALGVTLAACGDDDAADPGAGASSPAKAVFPVTIEHKYGSTTIPKVPVRVVTLGLSDQDAVLALGIKPVGAVDWFGERPFGKWTWTKELWGSTPPEIVGERDEYQVEKIIGLKPDLIIAQYSGMKQEQYDTLSKVAPVVAQLKAYPDYTAPWQEMTKVIGRALGQEAKVGQMLADVEKRFAAVRSAHPEWASQTAVVGDPFEPGQYALFAATDPKAQFMKELGFKLSDKVTELAGKETAAVISSERSDLLDVDRLVFASSDPTAEQRVKADSVYATLKVAKENRAVFVPYEEPPIGAALSFVTVLSVPYAIDQLVPLLEKAGK